jgi:glycerol-3-phosphate dehydrogenase
MNTLFNRELLLQKVTANNNFDIIIIGGGATGLGAAVDAASRGYKTLLVEQADFAKGTSSRATKLVHGGVRYLAQGDIKLVKSALKERGLMLKNAAHICKTLPFVIPCYQWWGKWYYGIGLTLYDMLAGKLSLGKTKILNAKQVGAYLPSIPHNNIKGGVLYTDGQFDDSRLAINLMQTAIENNAIVLNYCKAVGLLKDNNGKLTGVTLLDSIHNHRFECNAPAIINATGVFVDNVLQLDNASQQKLVAPSQGIHVVIHKKYFEGLTALMIPKTKDGRVLFAVPWHNYVIVGTTDTPVQHVADEPKALEEEITFVMEHIEAYMGLQLKPEDILSIYVGMRPLVKKSGTDNTAALSRDHTIMFSPSNLVTITGGKWTTYRKMAEDVINKTVQLIQLPVKTCVTEQLPIHGNSTEQHSVDWLNNYGSDAAAIQKLLAENAYLNEPIHPAFNYKKVQVVWAVRNEMAQTVEDVLSRRVRILFLDAQAAIEAAPAVATIIAQELGKDAQWIAQQVQIFSTLATQYKFKN